MRKHGQAWMRVVGLLAAVVLAGVATAAPRAHVKVTRGTCRIQRDDSVLNLKEEAEWRWIQAGDSLATAGDSTAVLRLADCGEVILQADSTLQILKMNLNTVEQTGRARLHLQQGALRALVGQAQQLGTGGRCDLSIKVGQATVYGVHYSADVAYHENGSYAVSVPSGAARVEHESGLLVLLGSGVVIDDGPPLTVTADADNENPIAVSQAGSVVYALQPGQSVTLEQTEEGFVLTNNSPDQPLYAIQWGGAPVVVLAPGQQHTFPITETNISPNRNQLHTMRLARVLSETFPEVLVGLTPEEPDVGGQVISAGEAFDQMMLSTTQRRGTQETSNSQ